MNYFVCIENNKVVGVLDYKPTVRKSISLVPIDLDEYKKLHAMSHIYDVETKNIVPFVQEPLEVIGNRDTTDKQFLQETDWKVLRHVREKALNVATSITEEDYLKLEHERHERAKRIDHEN
jgi:hypothetical protein